VEIHLNPPHAGTLSLPTGKVIKPKDIVPEVAGPLPGIAMDPKTAALDDLARQLAESLGEDED
jgi:hypothetical protein